MRLLAVLLLCLPLLTRAAPAPPQKLSREDAKRLRAAISDGRKADRKGDHKGAVAAFERALVLKPADPAILSELGWAAFQAKDLAKAEKSTRTAIDAASDYATQRTRAASLYNLGRILEEKAQKPAAIAAYIESLRLRPNRTVREQLAKLDPQAAADADPLKPLPLAGPFATLEAACLAATNSKPAGKSCLTSNGDGGKGGRVEKPRQPWLAVRYIQSADDEMNCYLAVRIKAGWFIVNEAFFCSEPGFLNQSVEEFAIDDVVPGGAPEVVLKLANEHTQRGEVELDEGDGSTRTASTLLDAGCDGEMFLCGVGPTGKPSCAHFPYSGAPNVCGSWDWQVTPLFTRDGQVDVKAVGKPTAEAKALTGKRPFTWP